MTEITDPKEKFFNAVSVMAKLVVSDDASCELLEEMHHDGVVVLVRKPNGRTFRVSTTGRELLMNSTTGLLSCLVQARFQQAFEVVSNYENWRIDRTFSGAP